MTASIKNYFPYLLPLLLIFSRSLADITIVLIGILFLYHSYKNIGWKWVKEKWFYFALIFSIYCLTVNSAMSIEPTETLAYSLFFIRWPIFAMALSYWILNDIQLLKKFFISMTISQDKYPYYYRIFNLSWIKKSCQINFNSKISLAPLGQARPGREGFYCGYLAIEPRFH